MPFFLVKVYGLMQLPKPGYPAVFDRIAEEIINIFETDLWDTHGLQRQLEARKETFRYLNQQEMPVAGKLN